MRLWLTIASLCFLLLLSHRRGGTPERLVAITMCIAFVWDLLVRILAGPQSFVHFAPLLFLSDLAVLLVFVQVAIWADRWWPLCISALQTIIVSIHILKLAGLKGMAGIYWAMTTIPFYLICMILLLGILLHARRLKRHEMCRDWRPA